MTNYPKLLLHYYRRSKDYTEYECRPDVAVYGFDLMTELGHIPESEYDINHIKLKDLFLRARRLAGATNYTIANNGHQYEHHVKRTIYKEYCLKWMENNENLALLMEQKIN